MFSCTSLWRSPKSILAKWCLNIDLADLALAVSLLEKEIQ